MIRLRQTDDLDEIRDLHSRPDAFGEDAWVGDDHTFWILEHDGVPVGFCSAFYYDDRKCVFLSRAYIPTQLSGGGLQRRMIRARVRWARHHTSANRVVTYVTARNYVSMVNLLKCRFQFYTPPEAWGPDGCHYLRLML